jgi:hypothetical protein
VKTIEAREIRELLSIVQVCAGCLVIILFFNGNVIAVFTSTIC